MSDLQSRLSERLGDRYTIERELGRGGMATVVLARERKHDRAVAIKVLRPELAVVLGTERFLREIDVAAGLQHPHILPLYDSGQADDLVYYVMPYVAGESLRDRLARERQLPVEEALGIARDVAGALAYAHSHGVVHRDIKPENILLTAGHAIVADFGIARALDAAGGERLTATGLALGTPAYMSPEQASASPDLDGRSDVYALGCVLYETLAGQPPFTGATVESLVAQHLTAAPPSVTTLRPAVPPAIATVIGRALAKTPADRFATAQQFREALSAVPPGPVTTATEPPRKRRPRASTGVALGMGAALLAVAFIVAWWLREPAGDSVTPEASIIVVVPFVPVTADTALGRLGRELAVTLSANLDGVGGIRTVEPLTVLAHVPEGASLSPDAGSALARQLGARAVLQGTLFRTATAIRIDASLATVDGDEVLARTTIAGQADDVLALTDSATFAILKQVWRRGEPAVPNVAAITTHSVEALRAYVEGEAALARADFVTAVDAFERAFAADSSFFFAYWRSLYPRVYEGTTRADRAVVAAVVAHRHEFPPVDRLMIESGMADSLSQRLAILRQATTRFPTYWPAWWSLANNLVHQFPYLGTTMGDARAALERTVELNPGFYPAWGHLFWYRILERDSALAERTFATLDAVGDRGAPRIEAIAEYFEELLHLVRHGGRLPAEQQAAAVAFVRGMPAPVPVEFLGFGFTDFRFPQAQVAVNEAVLALDPPRALAASMWFGIAMSAVARGQWRAVIPALTQWVAQDEHPAAPVVAYGLVVAGAHLGALDPADAAALRPGPEVELGSDEHRAERVWLDGILAHARADRGGMAEARAALPAAGGEFTDLLDRSLAAFELDLTGDRAQAARRLAALEWESAERVRHHRYARRHPFLVSVHRQFAARGLLAAGDTTQAERLLTWTDGILWGLHGFAAPFHRALAPAVAYERARIAAARGRTTEARTLLRQFIEAYDRPEGEWTARVEEALGLLRRLDDAAR